jgi:DNA-binding CsgD family transcriptional regulator
LVAEGLTEAQIALRFSISIPIVRSHLDRIRDKTGTRRRAELTRLASTLGPSTGPTAKHTVNTPDLLPSP